MKLMLRRWWFYIKNYKEIKQVEDLIDTIQWGRRMSPTMSVEMTLMMAKELNNQLRRLRELKGLEP